MMLPDNLAPFPVLPPSESSRITRLGVSEDFVNESAVKLLLIGPMVIAPPAAHRVPAGDGFAGREDLAALQESPFAALSSDLAYEDAPAKPFLPAGPHPALEGIRRAAPPAPRIESVRPDPRRIGTDRWWVLGLAIAVVALVSSGALIEMTSREAARRAQTAPAPAPPAAVFPADSGPELPAIASTRGQAANP